MPPTRAPHSTAPETSYSAGEALQKGLPLQEGASMAYLGPQQAACTITPTITSYHMGSTHRATCYFLGSMSSMLQLPRTLWVDK